MKAIMISIKPKWCALIMNGKKTIEVRKNKALASAIQKLIDEYGYADIYVYCSKSNYFGYISNRYIGKVVFKFRCYKVEHFEYDTCSRDICGYWLDNGQVFKNKGTCLSADELWNYIKGKEGYAINISDLEIFKPKELSEFHRIVLVNKLEGYEKPLTKAPQNMVYVEVEE